MSGLKSEFPTGEQAVKRPAYWTAQRDTILGFLRKNAFPLSTLYEGAVEMLYEGALPGRERFIGHAAREICNRLPDYLCGAEKTGSIEYQKVISQIAEKWQPAPLQEGGPPMEEIPIPRRIFIPLDELIRQHLDFYSSRRESALRFYESRSPGNAGHRDLLIPVATQWHKIGKWFVKCAHDSGPNGNVPTLDEVATRFDILEAALTSLIAAFYEVAKELDEILEDPTPEQVEKAIALLGRIEHNRYFFERLQYPLWVKALSAHGAFTNPPPIQIHEDGSLNIPPWPASQYLLRMAAHPEVHQEISEVMIKIGIPENSSVHQDFLRTSLLLSSCFQAKWARIETSWLKKQGRVWAGLLSNNLAELVICLLKGGQTEQALELIYELLELLPDEKSQAERKIEGLWTMSPRPRSRLEHWDYARIIEKVTGPLAQTADPKVLILFERLLNKAILCSRDNWEGIDSFHDFSYTWRPAIEDHPQNKRLHEIEESLVTALRNCALRIIREDPTQLRPIIDLLETFKPRRAIFARISLHLLTVFPQDGQDLIEARIGDGELFESVSVQHEYMQLLKQEFRNLPPLLQRRILWRIWHKYSTAKVRDLLAKHQTQTPKEEDVQAFITSHRVDWLSMIKDDLPLKWRAAYEKLSVRQKPSPHPDFPFYMNEMMHGDQSPISEQDASRLSLPELLSFLEVWKPEQNRFMGPSIRGLGMVLQSVIAKSPDRFCKEALALKLPEPTYVRSIIDAFRDVAARGTGFEWELILDLCAWAVSQPRELAGRDGLGDNQDPGWSWTRLSIARLLEEGFQREGALIPFELREKTWQILCPLTEDPSPTPEEEEKYGDSQKSPYDFALNCMRGTAMLAVMRYLSWVRTHLESQNEGEGLLKQGFGSVPEVREVLERRLNPTVEPSRAIRSIYGLYFPWLVQWDKAWTSQHIDAIFPREKEHLEFRLAAWNTYLQWCHPYDEPLELLSGEYLWAVSQIGQNSNEEKGSDSPLEKLGEHLITYYWRGKIDLDSSRALGIFLQRASDEIRGRVVTFVGHVLKNSPCDSVSESILDRLKVYWAERLAAAKTLADGGDAQSEMAAFGWWVFCRQFDAEWVLTNLHEALLLAHGIEMAPDVQAFLAECSPQIPGTALKCLALMIEGGRNPWEGPWIASHEEHNRPILKNSLQCGNAAVQAAAEDLINRLGAMGFLGYRDLLPTKP